ncbi:ArsR/SmtB family transcription factor [Limosilactobacillus difficilis]|uniref:ArsR/SmtB family transcription factor n=1 Tax=Limosilactobacillus difficilis TaxID=2991838 RepID=UPI0024BB5784|nr:metalloregulator ArsR/SmtB family transcription factor [Limosilactobacillus difficilis]
MSSYQAPELKDLESVSKLFKLLGHPKRLQLLYLLLQQSMSVSQISSALHWEQSAVSHQLQQMRAFNLVDYHRKGKTIIYHLKNPQVMTLIADVVSHTEQLMKLYQ